MNDGFFSMLGLAKKAGKIRCGEFAALEAITSQKARLIIVAEDASQRTKKTYRDKCDFYDIALLEYGTKGMLAKSIGKEMTAAIAVLDDGFAKSLMDKRR